MQLGLGCLCGRRSAHQCFEPLGAEEKLSTVIVSASDDMANIRTAMNRGAFDLLTKPIDFSLETTVDRTFPHVEVLREARRRHSHAERSHASLSRFCEPRWIPC